MKKTLLVFCTAIALVVGASAETAKDEVKIGEQYDKFVRDQFGVVHDEKIQKYASEMSQKLAASIENPEFQFHILVIDDPMINAFAVPGGYVYIARGMLAYLDSEAEFAGVLGHEMGHVIGHHSYKQMQKSMGDSLLMLAGLGATVAGGGGAQGAAAWVTAASTLSALNGAGYGRDLESQADEFGLIYSMDAGFDPREQSRFFRSLQFKERVSGVEYHGFMASHPETVERVVKSREKADILLNRGKSSVVNREQYIIAIEGLAYGRGDKNTKTPPPFVLKAYRTKEGDTYRGIARELSKDEGMAFEIAVMNGMTEKDAVPSGYLLKVPVPRKKMSEKDSVFAPSGKTD
ncbi:MAG: M48 family metalloprotease [Nitrospinae bacterium]|nr:M48 family metalloprotease [Nitrospinota bacterium]